MGDLRQMKEDKVGSLDMDEWIDTTQAAELSNLPVEEIRRLIRNHEIAAHKRGKYFWINKQSFVEYLTAHDRRVTDITPTSNNIVDETLRPKVNDTVQPSGRKFDLRLAYATLIKGYLQRHFPEVQNHDAEEPPTS